MNSATAHDVRLETHRRDADRPARRKDGVGRITAGHSAGKTSPREIHATGNPSPDPPPRRRLHRMVFWWFVGAVLGGAGTLFWGMMGPFGGGRTGDSGANPVTLAPARYEPDRAMGYLLDLCRFGPRPSGSDAMVRQQAYLQAFFESQGATVTRQTYQVRHPETGGPTPITNLIASWGTDRPRRYLLCAHYDTRPYPDQDRQNKRGVFIGANDGASGTAALMELSHHLDDLPEDTGVDLVLFDGEELVYQQGRDDYFLGSTYFADQYVAEPPRIPYQAGILLDMVGDRELKIYYERNSLNFAPDLVRDVWRVARRLRVSEFVPRVRHTITDDHLPLNQIAKIPTIDLIDFDYPRPGFRAPSYWHTEDDVPENCSGQSMAAVVWVVHEWLKQGNR